MASIQIATDRRLDISDLRERLKCLSLSLGIEPELRWSHGRRRGVFLKRQNAIVLGPKVADRLGALCHSVAHAWVSKNYVKAERHGLEFLECLWQVVLIVYDDPAKYHWYDECNEVFEFGRNRLRNLEEIV